MRNLHSFIYVCVYATPRNFTKTPLYKGFVKPLKIAKKTPIWRGLSNTEIHTYVQFSLFSYKYRRCFAKPWGTLKTFLEPLYTRSFVQIYIHTFQSFLQIWGCFAKPLYRWDFVKSLGTSYTHTYKHFCLFSYRYGRCFANPQRDLMGFIHMYIHMWTFQSFSLQICGVLCEAPRISRGLWGTSQNLNTQGALEASRVASSLAKPLHMEGTPDLHWKVVLLKTFSRSWMKCSNQPRKNHLFLLSIPWGGGGGQVAEISSSW